MKVVRVLYRLALLSLAAAAFAGLTAIYGSSVRPPRPGPRFVAAHWHRPAAPQPGRFPEFLGAGLVMAIFAIGGRLVFRLRLSPVSRAGGQPILLALGRQDCPSAADPPAGV